jgi:hypothetical protein
MNPGAVFFDREFAFNDGQTGGKLFIVLGFSGQTFVVAKTTSQQHGRGTQFGCQPKDRFHNFYIPNGASYIKGSTWVCLDEFYELNGGKMLQKRYDGKVRHICQIESELLKLIQDCALVSKDVSFFQEKAIRACLT